MDVGFIHVAHGVCPKCLKGSRLAPIKAPERFAANVMIGPSPSFINDGDYVGGFERDDIEELLETLENNYARASKISVDLRTAPLREQPFISVQSEWLVRVGLVCSPSARGRRFQPVAAR